MSFYGNEAARLPAQTKVEERLGLSSQWRKKSYLCLVQLAIAPIRETHHASTPNPLLQNLRFTPMSL